MFPHPVSRAWFQLLYLLQLYRHTIRGGEARTRPHCTTINTMHLLLLRYYRLPKYNDVCGFCSTKLYVHESIRYTVPYVPGTSTPLLVLYLYISALLARVFLVMIS